MYDPYRPPPPPARWPWVTAVVLVFVAAFVLYFLYVDGLLGGSPPGRPVGYFYFGFFPFFLALLFVVFVVRMVFWSRMWGYRGAYRRTYRGPDPAIQTVRQRYARGEISRDQYDQLMTELTRRRSGP